jgi:hypothetical protein
LTGYFAAWLNATFGMIAAAAASVPVFRIVLLDTILFTLILFV